MSVITSFSTTMRAAHKPRRSRIYTTVMGTGLALLGLGGAVHAQTIGLQQGRQGGLVKRTLGFDAFAQPGDPTTAVDPAGTLYNYIANPYMAVVQGINADRPTNYAIGQLFYDPTGFVFNAGGITLPIQVAGALSFGNLGGSLRIVNDEKRAMNGLGFGDQYIQNQSDRSIFGVNGGGVPAGYGVWPLPGYFIAPAVGGIGKFDYSAYVAAQVDGELVPVVGSEGYDIIPPTFRSLAGDNFLLSETTMIEGVSLNQQIRLSRNTAQMRWVVVNRDNVSRTVTLKFVVNQRNAVSYRFDPSASNGIQTVRVNDAFFYPDPRVGPTLRAQVYGVGGAAVIPDEVNMYGGRYQQDTPTIEPYHTRFTLSGFGATRPSTVFVGDSADLYPLPAGVSLNAGSFLPPSAARRLDKMENGTAVAVYYTVTVPPGGANAPSQSQPIICYYGNGNSTDRLDPDFAIGTEAEEAFQYNAGAAATLTAEQKSNPSLGDTARAFLMPQSLDVYGSVYNRQLSEAQFDIVLKDVRMSLTLPDALRFATLPTTGQPDTATKRVGDIPGDTDKQAQWKVEPTGELFGTYSYQLTANIGGISPLARTVSRAVTIPATPLIKVSADYYQQIGFPFEFDPLETNNGDTATIFNGLSKPNDTNEGSYRLYRFVPDPDQITPGKYVPVTKIERGEGYFYRPGLSRLLFLKGAIPDTKATPPEPGARVQYFAKVLETGWNMISNPFVYSVPVSYISLANIDNNDPNNNLDLTYFPDAVASGLVRGGVFFYNPLLGGGVGGYDFFQDNNQELKPYQGYWIYVVERKILRIAIPGKKQAAVLPAPDGSVPPTRVKEVAGAIASGRAFPQNQTGNNWKLQLAVKQAGSDVPNGRSDSTTLVGVAEGSKDGDDSRDLPKPPPLVNGFVTMRILHEEKDGKTRAFAQDLKAPGGKKTWNLEVVSDKDGPIAVSWPNLSRLPKTVRLTLTDTQTGRTQSLRGSSSILVTVSASKPSRFVLTADRQATRSLAFTNVVVKPEGRSVNGGSNYSLTFKVTADATVEAHIISLSGKVVSSLGGRAVSANGETRLLWNGRSQNGTALPIGAYNVELTARGEDGELIVEKRPLTKLQ